MRMAQWILTAATLVPGLAQAFGEMRGTVNFRLDSESARTARLSLHLQVNERNQATVNLQSEGTMEGVLDGTKVRVSAKNPKRFAFYQIELSPRVAASQGKTLIALNAADTEFCDEGANSLMTAFGFDGKATVSCVYFEMPK